MMKKINVILITFIALSFLFSCSDEKIINDTGNEKDLLLISYDNNSHLSRVKFPSGTIMSEDVFFEKNSKYITSAHIENIRPFLKYLFICIPDQNKLVVINKNTMELTAELDFSKDSLQPVDITFANATEAYLIFKESSKVALIDIYYFKFAKFIELEGAASAISAIGNQIYITLPLKDKVAIIDSREHNVVQSIEVTNVPYLIYPTIDGKKFVVVSAGMGKVPGDPRDAISLPSVSLIDVETRKILKSNSLNTPGLDLISELPNNLIVTNNDWAFILTGKYLIRIDARDPSYSNRVEEYTYKQLYQNNVYNELFALDSQESSSKIYQLNPITGKKLDNISIQKKIIKMNLY